MITEDTFPLVPTAQSHYAKEDTELMQVRRPGPGPGPGHGFRFIIYYHRYVLLICPNDDDGDDEDENKSVVTTDSGIYCNNVEPTTVSFFSSRLLEMSVDSSQMTKWRF